MSSSLQSTTCQTMLYQSCISIEQGATQLQELVTDSHTSYTHHQSVSEFQAAISKVLEDKLLGKIQRSKEFSIMIDESTDISVHQNMLVYIRIVEEIGGRWEPKSYFLSVRQLGSATAERLTSEVLDVLRSKDLDLANLVGISTDGASVMVGCKSGVVTRLKELCPSLLGLHCIAHRLALGCGSGADKVPYLVKFQEILNSIYKYFNYSPKHMACLEAIQAVVEGVEASRFKQVFHTRWLSFEGSVSAVVRNYSSLLSVFMEENSAKALSLYKPVSTYKFLYCAHFLADVLKQLCILSKTYQRSELDFSQVSPLLESTVSVLEDLRDAKSGTVLSEFLKVASSEPTLDDSGLFTFQFGGHTIRDSEQQRREAVSACEKFVSCTVSSLRERFSSSKDSRVMSAMCSLLSPSLDVEVNRDDIELVVDYLGRCGITDAAGVRQDVVGFRAYVNAQIVKNSKVVKSVTDVAQLGIKLGDSFPAIGVVCSRLLVLPVSTVDCERGFSRQNIIKTSLRNRMKVESLQNLLRISIDGPMEQIDFNCVFQAWATVKPRRILLN